MLTQYTLETAIEAIKSKNLPFIKVVELNKEFDFIVVEDIDYGRYRVSYRDLSPSMKFPVHTLRKRAMVLKKNRDMFVGKTINGVLIKDVFYAQDRGYRNRSIMLEYTCNSCGQTLVATFAAISKHKKSFKCLQCSRNDSSLHGERIRIDGILKKRSSTYIYWVNKKKRLPKEFQNSFSVFRGAVGEKPPKAELIEIDGKWVWKDLKILEDTETNLIAMAVRQVFRYSKFYKAAINKARIETNEGSRYRCDICGELFKRCDIEVDHIDPVANLDGTPLLREEIIKRIWTDKIQILDKGCHHAKSTKENKLRKIAKGGLKPQ